MSKVVEHPAARAPRDPVAKRALIVAAAERRLIAHGAGGFSMRAVAAEAGVSLSHLQYYFVSIEALHAGLAQHWAERFRSRFKVRGQRASTGEKRLATLVELMLDEIDTPAGSLGMWEFWMLGARDKNAARVLRALYGALYDAVADCLEDIHPGRTRPDNVARAKAIVGLIEGMGVLSSHAARTAATRRDMAAILRQAVAAIAGKL